MRTCFLILLPFLAAGQAFTQNVGIGQAMPTSKLDVNGGLSVGAAYSGTSAAPANGAIVQGNVGIGTASPQSLLHVNGGVALLAGSGFVNTAPHSTPSGNEFIRCIGVTSDYITALQDGGGRVIYYWNATTGSTNTRIVASEPSGKVVFSPASASWYTWQYGSPASAGSTITWKTQLVLDTLGRLGIGVTPATQLHVTGTAGTPNVRLASLGGTGTRMVAADASGNLSAVTPTTYSGTLGATATTTSTSYSTVLSFTFVAPPSGRVIYFVNGTVNILSASSDLYFTADVYDAAGATQLGTVQLPGMWNSTLGDFSYPYSGTAYFSGLTSGTTYTAKIQWRLGQASKTARIRPGTGSETLNVVVVPMP